ncbi:MAG: sugar ABC transporter permease [Terricaulis silvestris]
MTRKERAAWSFVSPAFAAIAAFFVVPLAGAFLLSFTDFDIYALADTANLRFIGLENYTRLAENPLFWKAMGVTLWFVLFGTPITIVVSLCAALLLNARAVRLKPIWRVAFFAPYVTTVVATAVVWRYLLHTRYGMINFGLNAIGLPSVDWLGDPHWALPAILLFVIWKTFGYNMLIFLAALQTVPRELTDAARVDGAGAWLRFRFVTLPAIAPAIVLASIVSMASFFQLFAEPYVMTLGGPAQSTVTALYFMYEEGFKWWSLGSASAVAFILFLCIFGVALLQLWASHRLERVRR